MHIAVGYYWFPPTTGYHLERALRALGHRVSYVGLPSAQRLGYDQATPIGAILEALSPPADLYLWIDPADRYFPSGIEDLSIPTACYLIDVHLGNWRQHAARFFDVVFIAQKDYVPAFRRAIGHDQVHWLPLAAASDMHYKLDLPLVYDVGFVGNVHLAHRATARVRRLKLLADRFKTNDFFRFYPPQEISTIYSRSRIIFNTSLAGDVNMRIFEGTACGALLITDATANGLSDLFEIGHEIVTYTNDEDLIRKIDFYLTHDEERLRIARAGHDRTRLHHTYQHRAQAIVDTVAAPGFKRSAPMRIASSDKRRSARFLIYTHLHMLDALLDEARAARYNPLQRFWIALPCLARKLRL